MRKEKCRTFSWGSLKENDHLEDRCVDRSMRLEWILSRLADEGCGVDSPGSGQRPMAGCCEHGDEPSGSGATELVIFMICPLEATYIY
jgi:hypothetical protein